MGAALATDAVRVGDVRRGTAVTADREAGRQSEDLVIIGSDVVLPLSALLSHEPQKLVLPLRGLMELAPLGQVSGETVELVHQGRAPHHRLEGSPE